MNDAPPNAAASRNPLRLSRFFPAPRATVFEAWSGQEHLQRWFAPTGFTVPHVQVEPRVGGIFELCMRGPDGTEHWLRGSFVEFAPVERLVFDVRVEDAKAHALFGAYTEANFAEAPGGTRLDVMQRYTVLDPAAAWMVAGAPEGWGQTLEKLAAEVARIAAEPHVQAMSRIDPAAPRSVVHASFHLERVYDAPIARVFKAFADPVAKSKWFGGAGPGELFDRAMDFRVGGRETLRGRWPGGVVSSFEAVYHDIVAPERIVYSYVMHLNERKISVSLATLQLKAKDASRTALMVTEQGAFLDGYDDAGARERGTGELLDLLGASLRT
jgi:uncharacterized protein YndB with AHSA1/START domain